MMKENIRLVQHLHKCLNSDGGGVEKQTFVVSSSDVNIRWMNTVFFVTKWF
jgi:hypothetical protein